MEQNLKKLQLNQKILGDFKAILDKEKDKFNEENKDLIFQIVEIEKKQEEFNEKVRVEAIEEFEKTGEKKLLGGIGIRILSKLIYTEHEAMLWSRTNMSVAIKEVLDKKQFENYAKANNLDFVKKEEKVSVTFPKEITI